MKSLRNTIQTMRLRLESGSSGTDEELLSRFVAAGDEAAFAALVRRHGPMVLRVCQRVLHHSQDAEDAFQATFIVLARKAAAVASPALLANWLYGVAQRVASKARVAASKRCMRESLTSQTGLDLPAEPGARPAGWHQTLLDEELRRLPDKYRAPLVLCYLEGKSSAEAARLLHCEIGAVKMRLSRARALLHGRLARRGVTLTPAVLAAVLAQEATAAARLPACLIWSTVQAGLTSPGSGVASAAHTLAAGVLLEMGQRRLPAAVLLAAIALLGVGGVAFGLWKGTPSSASTSVPQFSQVSTIEVFGTGSDASTFAQYYVKGSGGGPNFWCENFPGPTTIVTFNNSALVGGVSTLYPFTVKIAASTPTYQQVFLTARGTMTTTNAGGVVTTTPVKLQVFITISAKVVPGEGRLAGIRFTALNPADQQVFASGEMTGSWQ